MKLTYNTRELAAICSKYEAEYLGVFGSISRGEETADSDIDLLVRFAPESQAGLIQLSAMRDELEQLLNRKVDLLTEGFLSKHFRDEVKAEAKPLYVKT